VERRSLLEVQAAKTVTTSAPMVEVARSPMLDLLDQERPRVPVSPKDLLVANAAGLQASARIATRLSTASTAPPCKLLRIKLLA